jgi:hypothetical protein
MSSGMIHGVGRDARRLTRSIVDRHWALGAGEVRTRARLQNLRRSAVDNSLTDSSLAPRVPGSLEY